MLVTLVWLGVGCDVRYLSYTCAPGRRRSRFYPRLLPSHMHVLYNLVNLIRKPKVSKDVQATGTNVCMHLFGPSLTKGFLNISPPKDGRHAAHIYTISGCDTGLDNFCLTRACST